MTQLVDKKEVLNVLNISKGKLDSMIKENYEIAHFRMLSDRRIEKRYDCR